MIYLLGTFEDALIAFVGILFAFAATCIAIDKLNRYLPKDMGRQFAHDGTLSAGKPRGAGIIFVLVFVVSALLFGKMNLEIAFYLILIIIEMLTGFFDDASDKPWGEYLKGFLDLAVAVVGSTGICFTTIPARSCWRFRGITVTISAGSVWDSYGDFGVGIHQCDRIAPMGWMVFPVHCLSLPL